MIPMSQVASEQARNYYFKGKNFLMVPDPTLEHKGYLVEHEQPIYYKKYGCTNTHNGMPVVEYIRYRKWNKKSRDYYDTTGEYYYPEPEKPLNLSKQRDTDTEFSCSRATSDMTVDGEKNIYLLINYLLGTSGRYLLTKDTWENLSDKARFQYLLDASRALMFMVIEVHPALRKDINIISLNLHSQRGMRRYRLILWRSLATHLRFHMKSQRINVTYKGFKYLADHHPCASLRKSLKFSEVGQYYPTIKAEDTTVIEEPSGRRRWGLWDTNMYTKDEHMLPYIEWLRASFPLTSPRIDEDYFDTWKLLGQGKGAKKVPRGTKKRKQNVNIVLATQGLTRYKWHPTPDLVRFMRGAAEQNKHANRDRMSKKEVLDFINELYIEDDPFATARNAVELVSLAYVMGVDPYCHREQHTFCQSSALTKETKRLLRQERIPLDSRSRNRSSYKEDQEDAGYTEEIEETYEPEEPKEPKVVAEGVEELFNENDYITEETDPIFTTSYRNYAEMCSVFPELADLESEFYQYLGGEQNMPRALNANTKYSFNAILRMFLSDHGVTKYGD